MWCWWPREGMLWGLSMISEFCTSLSKVQTLWHCVKVKQHYQYYFSLHPVLLGIYKYIHNSIIFFEYAHVCIRWEPRELEVSSQWGRKLDSCASYQPKGAKLTGRAAYCDAVGRLPCDILIFARQSCVMSPHKPCVILKVWLVSWSLAHFTTAFLRTALSISMCTYM